MLEKHPHGWYIYKERGETMGQLCSRLRSLCHYDSDTRMTYAGRLDPLAEGVVLVLVNEGVMYKDDYLGFPKEYELDILFGYTTDTHDILGYVGKFISYDPKDLMFRIDEDTLKSFTGDHDQEYPAYSSKTANGVPLFEHARRGTLPNVLPRKHITIQSIATLSRESDYSHEALLAIIRESIECVSGDFRQAEILDRWNKVFTGQKQDSYLVLKCVVRASSGTYMRSLAHRIGEKYGVGGIALHIARTRLGEFCFETQSRPL